MLSQQILKSIIDSKDQSFKIRNPWNISMHIRISNSTQMIAFGYYPNNLSNKHCFNILLEKPYDFSTDIQYTEQQVQEIYASLAISFPKLNNNYLKFFTLLHENGLIK